jgi:predicted  nucleic acid-binding Zn-ribbon protein
MTTNKRHRNRWTINETLSLQREYQLLEWTVYKIAEKHQRTVLAIMSKLQKEKFIESWNEARGFNIEQYQEDNYVLQTDTNYEDIEEDEEEEDEDEDEEDEDEDEDEEYYTKEIYIYNNGMYEVEIENNVKQIMNRVWSIQTSICQISSFVKELFNIFSTKKTQEQEAN